MNVYKHIRAFILADGDIATRIGTRFYPIKVPQAATYPAMTMQRISGVRFPPLKGRASLARPRYQFDVWTKEGVASAFDDCQALGRLLLDRLEGKNIDVQDDTVSPSETRRISFEFISDQDLFEPGTTTTGGGYYRYSADYYVWHQADPG